MIFTNDLDAGHQTLVLVLETAAVASRQSPGYGRGMCGERWAGGPDEHKRGWELGDPIGIQSRRDSQEPTGMHTVSYL